MYISIGTGFMVGTIKDKMVPYQPCRERNTGVHGIVGAITEVGFSSRNKRGRTCLQAYSTAEGTISMCAGTDTTLNLCPFEEGGITVHVGPEYTLVFRRVERYTINGDIDA